MSNQNVALALAQHIMGSSSNELTLDPHAAVLDKIAVELRMGKNVSLALDVDKTLVHPKAQEGLIAAAPDAWHAPDLKNIIEEINRSDRILCFAVSGRSVSFLKEHFSLSGSGQFHAEMSDVFSGEHHILKPLLDISNLHSGLTTIAKKVGGYLEDDKTHHLCVMADDISDEIIGGVERLVETFNTSHGASLVVEHGVDFCEVGPPQTSKAIAYGDLIFSHRFFDECFEVYLGDTPSIDGPAMELIQSRGGLSVAVGDRFKETGHTFEVFNTPDDTYELLKGVKGLLDPNL